MNKKQRTIRAHGKLIEMYRNGSYSPVHCPLCDIHGEGTHCSGCPLACRNRDMGCMDFKSFQKARKYTATNDQAEAFEERAQFHEKIIPILEKIAAERFTVKGWKFFDELDRDW